MDRAGAKKRIARTRRERRERMDDFYAELMQDLPVTPEPAKPEAKMPPLLNDFLGTKETMH